MQHRHALATLQLVAVRKRAYVLRLCALSTDGCRVPAYALGKLYNSVTGQNDIKWIERKHVKYFCNYSEACDSDFAQGGSG